MNWEIFDQIYFGLIVMYVTFFSAIAFCDTRPKYIYYEVNNGEEN
jgi:hypothetical protein